MEDTKQFIATMMEYTLTHNAQDLNTMIKRSCERAKEGLRFFGLDDSGKGSFNIMWILLAILWERDSSAESKKSKIRRVFQLDSEGVTWVCNTRGSCVIL